MNKGTELIAAINDLGHPYVDYCCRQEPNGDVKVTGYLIQDFKKTARTVVNKNQIDQYDGDIEGAARRVTKIISGRLMRYVVPEELDRELVDDEA